MTRKEIRITMQKNIFISFIFLFCILLAFISNTCSFIHPAGENKYEILVSKKVKKGLMKGKVEIRMSEWIVKHHKPSQI